MSWQRLKLGYLCERIIGFSLPVAVISYEGIHIVSLARPEAVVHCPEFAEGGDVYDPARQQLEFAGRSFSILGLHGGAPRLRNEAGEHIVFADGNEFTVRDSAGREIFTYAYDDLSGDWRVATFTPNDDYILFGLPDELHIFQRDRDQ